MVGDIAMIFAGKKEENGWALIEYTSTWNYGYDFMLDAAQVIIDTDFKEDLQRIAIGRIAGSGQTECLEEVKSSNFILRDCNATKTESGVLIIAGQSKWMKCPFQLMFFNQTRIVRLYSPALAYFQEHGEHVFDNYLNSAEIQAYCRATERNTIEKLKSNDASITES